MKRASMATLVDRLASSVLRLLHRARGLFRDIHELKSDATMPRQWKRSDIFGFRRERQRVERVEEPLRRQIVAGLWLECGVVFGPIPKIDPALQTFFADRNPYAMGVSSFSAKSFCVA